MTNPASTDERRRRLVLAALLAATCFLGSRRITDEASVMLGGDMARYVMDGVFVHDLVARGGVWSIQGVVGYTERYYARYPALSLGHHPPLPYVALAPFFALLGVSLFAARLAALGWFVLAAWSLHAVATRMFNWRAASWAMALFVTNLVVLRAGQYVLSEMPMVALVLVAVNALFLYCESGRPTRFAWFVIAVVATLSAKQLAGLMLPVYAVILSVHGGWRQLVTRRTLLIAAVGALATVPLIVMTVTLAPVNVAFAVLNAKQLLTGSRETSVVQIVRTIVTTHLSWPALFVTATSGLVLMWRRNRQLAVGLIWIACVIGGSVVFAGAVEPARYAFGAIPAYCLLAAGLVSEARTKAARGVVVALLSGTVLWQSWLIRDVRPSGAGGYEAAAQYVLDHSREPVMLYDSAVDTGYFVFFVRKHDSAGGHVVLRADKVITPSEADPGSESAQLYSRLLKFGIRFVVVEEGRAGSPLLRGWYQELRTARFVERRRIPIVSTVPEVRGGDLVVYEFREAGPPDPDAELDISLPRGDREIRLHLRDLIGTDRQ